MKFEIGPGGFTLAEILKELALTHQTGVLKLSTPSKEGVIWLRAGSPIHAAAASLEGVDALYALGQLKEGWAVFEPGEVADKVTIDQEFPGIQEFIERRQVEVSALKWRLPPLTAILERSPELPRKGGLSIRRTDLQVLALFDGRRSLKDVLERSPLDEATTCQAVSWLLETELLLDPKSSQHRLERWVEWLSEVITRLGDDGLGRGYWLRRLKELISGRGDEPQLSRLLLLSEERIEPSHELNLAPEQIDRVFTALARDLRRAADEAYGRALARWKLKGLREWIRG